MKGPKCICGGKTSPDTKNRSKWICTSCNKIVRKLTMQEAFKLIKVGETNHGREKASSAVG
jgi:hypothetical protein